MSVVLQTKPATKTKNNYLSVEIESTQQSIHVDFWMNLYKYY